MTVAEEFARRQPRRRRALYALWLRRAATIYEGLEGRRGDRAIDAEGAVERGTGRCATSSRTAADRFTGSDESCGLLASRRVGEAA